MSSSDLYALWMLLGSAILFALWLVACIAEISTDDRGINITRKPRKRREGTGGWGLFVKI